MKEGTIFLVLIFPKPWPTNLNIVLIDKKDGDINLQVIAYPDGHLSFLLKEQEKILIEKHFQKVSIKNVGRAIMSLIWKGTDAQMFLNGEELIPFGDGTSVLVLKEKEIGEKHEDLFNLPNPDKLKDNYERFFIETIIDIIEKLRNDRKYDTIKASGLLRHLLLDKEPLVYKINKKYKVKLEFEVIEYKEKIPIENDLELHIRNLDSNNFPGAKTVKTSLKELLSINCINYKGTEITVKELIKYCAHIKGGIHTGKPEDKIDETLIAIDDKVKMLEEESSIILLKGIIQIILKGLKPLVRKISANIYSAI